MSAPPQSQGDVIADKAQLVEYLEAGCKPADAWRIGTEHEKFCYGLDDFRPLPYAGERSIRALLEGLQRFGWAAVTEGDNVIALAKNGASVSLEPGVQFELSGAPLKPIPDTCAEAIGRATGRERECQNV